MLYPKSRIFLVAASLFSALAAGAQSGVVYSFDFKIAPELTNYEKVEYDRNWFSEFSEGEAMPESLVDSIKLKTEEAFTAKFNIPVKMCYHEYKSDVRFTSERPGSVEGLPELTTLKRGKKDCPDKTRYISLNVQIYSSSSSVTSVNTKTKLKPRIEFQAKVVDEENNEIWKNKVVLKDFDKLRSETRYYQGKKVTKSEVLSPLDIYDMYQMALEKLMSE